MIKRIYGQLLKTLSKQSFRTEAELGLRLMLMTAVLFCVLAHIFLFLIHLAAWTVPLILLNICSLLAQAVAGFLLQKGRYTASGLLISLDISLYSLISIILIGADNYTMFYFFLVLIIQLIIPYSTFKVRLGMGIALWIFMIASISIELFTPPLIMIGRHNKILSVFNLHLALFAVVLELSINNVARKLLAQLNDVKMEELQGKANTDPLTSLYNRRYADEFFRSFADTVGMGKWCVAMLDIDDFKLVNDQYGHQVGDVVLRSMADKMVSCLRSSDLVFRWGGEEFLLLLKDVELDVAYTVLDQLRKNIADAPIQTAAGPLLVTTTIGVAALDLKRIDSSIELCDKKLYEGKHTGKNKCVA